MTIPEEIQNYLAALPEEKRLDMEELHRRIQELCPGCRLWFLDGKNDAGKVVSNPNIGYGQCFIPYASGKSREFYQVGISANQSGISLYLFGLPEKTLLSSRFADKIGKASITSYCIKFKNLKSIHMEVLEDVILTGLNPDKTSKPV